MKIFRALGRRFTRRRLVIDLNGVRNQVTGTITFVAPDGHRARITGVPRS